MKVANSGGKSPISAFAKAIRHCERHGLGMLMGLGLLSGPVQAQAVWNLPYARPAAYDYSNLYSPTLKAYLAIKPDFFKAELQAGWTYYKANFIMSNGLVNHRRLENNALVGTNEAVSEGQGYGTLLAVLMNDQTTFNRIFEAANTNMWDNGKKSYYVWRWPGGGQGAAADADLDIGLALVFADELQKAKLWQPYSKGGITYQSRAMDIIKSIKANMTAQNYLLPGDNWGGEGVNNLNPSYFCTAWLKVFNAYQKEVDFTAVINNSYTVLAKTPRYAYAQAPDWCNPSGGQASQAGGKPQQGLGMLSDGIRTPYRIAMDALWFNDERAIAYCKNAKKTLTEYTNTTNIRVMAAQMAHYDKNGQAIVETKGSFDNVAMWSCAVLGSKDVEFTQKATHSSIIGLISGTSADYFGDVALQDDKFYYKQSLGLLGMAVIGGQFPNILADPKAPVSLILPDRARTRSASRLSRSATPLWLTSEGIPSASPSGYQAAPAAAVYRNALGQAALPLP